MLRDSQVLAEVSGYEVTLYSNRLFRDIALLQEQANFRLSQVDVFAVAAGPGSFTGLRVGLTAVKAWAEVHGKPIAAVSGLEAIAAESLTGHIPGASHAQFIAPFLDARRGQIFGAIYQRISGDAERLVLIGDETILSLDEYLEMVKGKLPHAVALVSPTPEMLPAARIEQALPARASFRSRRPWLPRLGGWDLSAPSAAIWSMRLLLMLTTCVAPTLKRPGRTPSGRFGRKDQRLFTITVRRMSAQDVTAALSILEESPEASFWSRESLLESSAEGTLGLRIWMGASPDF